MSGPFTFKRALKERHIPTASQNREHWAAWADVMLAVVAALVRRRCIKQVLQLAASLCAANYYKFLALIWQSYSTTAEVCLEFLGRWVSRQSDRAPAASRPKSRRQVLRSYGPLGATSHNFVRVWAQGSRTHAGSCYGQLSVEYV